MALGFQLSPELHEVLYYAIVGDSDLAEAIGVGVGIGFGRATVSSPTCMPDPTATLREVVTQRLH